jgi:Uma2 family endonuclease
MPAATVKMPLAEFMRLPDRENADLELCDGEVVEVPLPSLYHMYLQETLEPMLRSVLPEGFFIRKEFSYGFKGEAHRADIGAVPLERWNSAVSSPAGKVLPFPGAPDLLIEILSPSNTAMELNRLRRLCFENGCKQFWVVDPGLKTILVFERLGPHPEYGGGDSIPLRAVTGGDQVLPLTSIFRD